MPIARRTARSASTAAGPPDHRRYGDWGRPGRPKRLPYRAIDLRQGQQEVLATDPAVLHPPTVQDGRPERSGQLIRVTVEHTITRQRGRDACGGPSAS